MSTDIIYVGCDGGRVTMAIRDSPSIEILGFWASVDSCEPCGACCELSPLFKTLRELYPSASFVPFIIGGNSPIVEHLIEVIHTEWNVALPLHLDLSDPWYKYIETIRHMTLAWHVSDRYIGVALSDTFTKDDRPQHVLALSYQDSIFYTTVALMWWYKALRCP